MTQRVDELQFKQLKVGDLLRMSRLTSPTVEMRLTTIHPDGVMGTLQIPQLQSEEPTIDTAEGWLMGTRVRSANLGDTEPPLRRRLVVNRNSSELLLELRERGIMWWPVIQIIVTRRGRAIYQVAS